MELDYLFTTASRQYANMLFDKRYKCKQINTDIYYMEANFVHQRGLCLHTLIGQLRLYTTGQTLLIVPISKCCQKCFQTTAESFRCAAEAAIRRLLLAVLSAVMQILTLILRSYLRLHRAREWDLFTRHTPHSVSVERSACSSVITADELFFLWRLLKYVKQQKLRGE